MWRNITRKCWKFVEYRYLRENKNVFLEHEWTFPDEFCIIYRDGTGLLIDTNVSANKVWRFRTRGHKRERALTSKPFDKG